MELRLLKENKHILLIIIGSIFILLGLFHTNLWFDETYTVNIINHSFKDIWQIGSNDVHPILYYFLLKIISLIFGKNIIIYRLFSSLGIITLGIIGYTHIRKDYGDKIGKLFSFFTFFLPVSSIFAGEIRMYSWSITLVSLTFIYMMRIIKNNTLKNNILFMIFSLMSAYIHYYGLIISFFINLFLFIYLIIKKRNLKYFILSAIVQIVSYLPWLIIFYNQTKKVSKGFWITLEFPNILLEILNFQFLGNNEFNIACIVSIIIYIFIFYSLIKNKEKIPLLSFSLYLIVIITVLIISIKMPIITPRYLFVITGLLIFTMSYLLSKSSIYINTFICLLILVFSIYNNTLFIKDNYDKSNGKQIKYVKENIGKDDIIIYTDVTTNSIYNLEIDNKIYFFDIDNWQVDEAYKAFSNMTIVKDLNFLDDLSCDIWVLDTRLYELLENYKLIKKENFKTKYHQLDFDIYVVRK